MADQTDSLGHANVPLADRVRLAHCAVDDIAAELGIRVLHFKGPVAADAFPQRPSGMGDIDVIVDPARLEDLVLALQAHGWWPEHKYRYPELNHAVLLHKGDPFFCTFDLHVRYPGIALSDESSFAQLWEHRSTAVLGGRELAVLERPAHAVLLLLEAARNYAERPERNQAKIDGVNNDLAESERFAMWQIAENLGAAGALAAVLTPPESVDASSTAWDLRISSPGGLTMWLARIHDAPSWARKIRLSLAALYPAAITPAGVTPLGIKGALARWGRGLRQLRGLLAAKPASVDGQATPPASASAAPAASPANLAAVANPEHVATTDHPSTHAAPKQPEAATKQETTSAQGGVGTSFMQEPVPTQVPVLGQETDAPAPEDQGLQLPEPQQLAALGCAAVLLEDERLAVLARPDATIAVLEGPSVLLWLAGVEYYAGNGSAVMANEAEAPATRAPEAEPGSNPNAPLSESQAPEPVTLVASCFEDLPPNGVAMLEQAWQQLLDMGLLGPAASSASQRGQV